MSENPGGNQRLQKLSPLTRGENKSGIRLERTAVTPGPYPVESRHGLATHQSRVEHIGLAGKKSELAPEVLKAAALACIEGYPKSYVQCYIDGSATGGTKDGGYGFTIKWPTGEADTIGFGPVGTSTCSFECEKMRWSSVATP